MLSLREGMKANLDFVMEINLKNTIREEEVH